MSNRLAWFVLDHTGTVRARVVTSIGSFAEAAGRREFGDYVRVVSADAASEEERAAGARVPEISMRADDPGNDLGKPTRKWIMEA